MFSSPYTTEESLIPFLYDSAVNTDDIKLVQSVFSMPGAVFC